MGRGEEVVAGGIGSIVFAYCVLLRLPAGFPRLVALLPWIALLCQSAWDVPTIHLRAITTFFFVWMIPSKLLLLCWNAGPAQDPSVQASFPRFFAAMALSIHIPRCDPSTDKAIDQSTAVSSGNPDQNTVAQENLESSAGDPKCWKSWSSWCQESLDWQAVLIRASIKVILVVFLFAGYRFRDRGMPEIVLFWIFSLHIYLACSLIFEAIAATAAATIGITLEPQFDRPYLAASLSEFWGKRWNRLVSSMLKASVYDPVQSTLTRLSHGGKSRPPLWVRATATMVVFLVSGLMHEVIFLYINKSAPTWQVTGFFLVNGLATIAEVAGRRTLGSTVPDKVPRPLRVALTIGFIFSSAALLFFPPIHRPGSCFQALDEFEHILRSLTKRFSTRT